MAIPTVDQLLQPTLEAYGWLNGLVDKEVRNGLVAEPYGTHEKG
jgi:hypothetical protein